MVERTTPRDIPPSAPDSDRSAKLLTQDAATELIPAGRAPPAEGDVLNRRFVLEEAIGRGGMGIVYRARDLRKEEAMDRDPHVAVKVLNADLQDHPDAFIALQRECKRAQRLAHPNIATVYDFDRDGPTVYMTMELLHGESFEQLLKRLGSRGLPPEQAFPLITGMGSGLAHAHAHGIVHSDFKPANAFIAKDGRVRVLDFGIARALSLPGETAQDKTLFNPKWDAMTPAYASCEMFHRAPPDPRDDIYALACVSYELLAGRHPFEKLPADRAREEERVPARVVSLDKRQNQALARALAFDRERRTATVEQFLADLTANGSSSRRSVAGWAVALALALAAVAVTAVSYLRPQPAPNPERVASPPPIPAPVLEVATQDKISRILEVADLHLQVGRLSEPEGSNAYAAYQEVLQLQPGNSQARAGLEQIAAAYVTAARSELDRGDSRAAMAEVAQGLALFPGHPDLSAIERRIAAASGQ